MPDSSALLTQKHTGSQWELWSVPINGSEPRKLDIDPVLWREGFGNEGTIIQLGDGGFMLSPDGRRVAIVVGKKISEIWALENLQPKPVQKR